MTSAELKEAMKANAKVKYSKDETPKEYFISAFGIRRRGNNIFPYVDLLYSNEAVNSIVTVNPDDVVKY